MGFDKGTVQFLLNAKRIGLKLDRVLMIGRQTFFLSAQDLHALLNSSGFSCSLEEATRLRDQDQGYCESFLRYIGAENIDSMDISSYESATVIHDMNQPLPEEWHGKFSLVIDGGSLEHVFNYPTAIANCMLAVEPGGHLVTITPTNNLMGHGFYQISPELLFRVLSSSNGYQLRHMIVYEHPWNGSWYQVADPQHVRSRVELINKQPAYLIACAERTAIVPFFRETPQQSDYARLWGERDQAPVAGRSGGWKQSIPPSIVQWYRKFVPFRPPYFQKLPQQLENR